MAWPDFLYVFLVYWLQCAEWMNGKIKWLKDEKVILAWLVVVDQVKWKERFITPVQSAANEEKERRYVSTDTYFVKKWVDFLKK